MNDIYDEVKNERKSTLAPILRPSSAVSHPLPTLLVPRFTKGTPSMGDLLRLAGSLKSSLL